MSKTVKVAELILDHNLYPRQEVDSSNKGDLAEALRVGEALPPVVADRKSKRVIDGFHRVKAVQMVFGAEAEIAVEWRDYEDEVDMFRDAMKLNAAHGRKLSSFDKTRCILKAEKLGIDTIEAARILNITPRKLGKIEAQKIGSYRGEKVALKRTMDNFAGRVLKKEHVKANRLAGGMRPLFYVNQLSMLIEADAVDKENANLVAGLCRLKELLDNFVAKAAA